MKVLFFTPKFHPEPNYYINDVVFDIEGFNKIVVTGSNIKSGKYQFSKRINDVKIYYVPYFLRSGNSLLSLFFEYLSFLIFSIILIPIFLILERPKIIFHYGITPPVYSLPFIILKPIFRYKFIYWVQDIWPEFIFTRLRSSGLLYNFIFVVMNFIYEFSDKLIVISEGFKDDERFKKFDQKVLCLAQGMKKSHGKNLSSKAQHIAENLKKENKLKVVFAGNISNGMYLEEFCESIESNIDKFVFYIIGDGPLKQYLKDKRFNSVKFYDLLPRNEIGQIVKLADFSFLGRQTDSNLVKSIIPSKLALYLESNAPIIAIASGYVANFINEHRIGFTFDDKDINNLSDFLKILALKESSEIENIKSNQNRIFEKKFNHKKTLENLARIISE